MLLDPGAVVAGLLAAQAFDLDDLGAHAGEDLGAPWPGLVAAQVDDSHVLQRVVQSCHCFLLSRPARLMPYSGPDSLGFPAFYGPSSGSARRQKHVCIS